jgi:hypothetical protein
MATAIQRIGPVLTKLLQERHSCVSPRAIECPHLLVLRIQVKAFTYNHANTDLWLKEVSSTSPFKPD